MYNVQLIEERIMSIASKMGLSKNKLLINAHMGKSFFDNMKKGQVPSVEKLHTIADYLNVSIDYLVGRTNEQTTTYNNDNSVIQGNSSVAVTGSSSISGSIFGSGSISTTIPTNESKSKELSKEETEILNTYRLLDARNRTKFMNFVFEMEDKIEET